MSANRILFLTFVPFISSLSFAYENCNHFQTPYDRAYCQTKLLVQSEQDVKSAYEAVFK